MHRPARLLLAMMMSGTYLGGCATTPEQLAEEAERQVDPQGGAPMDFSIEATVLAPMVYEPEIYRKTPAHLRQSRYVLFCDGVLHDGLDPDHKFGAEWLPPVTRTLSHLQMAELWALASQLGFADPARGSEAFNFRLVKPGPDEVVTMVGFCGNGRRWCFIRRQQVGQPEDPAMAQLVRQLAILAWGTDREPPESHIVPKRYDFGPDPYLPYRRLPPAK